MKEKTKVAKKKIDKSQIFVKVMAIFLALLMVLGVGATLLYYIIAK